MLKHLDRKDVSESVQSQLIENGYDSFSSPLLLLEIVHIHIARDDLDVLEPLGLRHTINVYLLSARVGQHGDVGPGIVL